MIVPLNISCSYVFAVAAYATNTTLEAFYDGNSQAFATGANIINQTQDGIAPFTNLGNASRSMKENAKLRLRMSGGNPT